MLTMDLREWVYIMGPIQAQTPIGFSETRVMRWEKLNSTMKNGCGSQSPSTKSLPFIFLLSPTFGWGPVPRLVKPRGDSESRKDTCWLPNASTFDLPPPKAFT
ncbi:hypothetical protein GBA52_022612 [Prunus armeniaca]|nr:hypothetical protein GBA52_022612 [Prunus armeniaca]